MVMKWIGASVLTLATIAALVPSGARAADPGFCRQYAESAMRQISRARQIPNCASRLGGGRWNYNYDVHFNWCLGAPYPAADNERRVRRDFLDRCSHGY